MSFVLIGGTGTAVESTVTVASATFALTMQDGIQYLLTSTTAAWINIGSAPTAVVRGSTQMTFIAPNYPYVILCQGGLNKVAIVRDAADGFASLSQTAS